MLRLQAVGELAVIGSSPGSRTSFAHRKAGAIVGYLSLESKGAVSRERLTGLLWSERSEEQARASLRQCVRRMRDLFDGIGFDGIEISRSEIKLSLASLELDVDQINAALARGEVPAPLLESETIAQDLLAGYEALDPSFAAWLQVKRQNWHEHLSQGLQRILAQGQAGEAQLQAALALVLLDSTHEEAHRHLIRHYAESGNVAKAIGQYDRLWRLLDSDYDMEPDEETQALIVAVKDGSIFTKPSPAQPVPQTDGAQGTSQRALPHIVILPFRQGGPWDGEAYFIDGFRRELAGALSRFREWIVIEVDRKDQVLEALNAKPGGPDRSFYYALEGIYYRVGQVVSQTISLKNMLNSEFIWSEQIDLTIENWFGFRRQLLQRISATLNIYLSADRLKNLAGRPTVSLEIYDQWLQGQSYGFAWTPEGDEQAAKIFQSIITQAPAFAPAYSSLVQIENTRQLVNPGILPSAKREEYSLSLAKTAVKLDPVDTKTQLALGWSYIMNRQYDQGEINFRLAYDLNASDPWTIVSSAMGLAFCAKYEDAISLADQALHFDLNPSQSHWLYQSNIRFLCGRTEEAAQMGERAGEVTHGCVAWRSAALSEVGDKPAAEATGQRFLEMAQANWQGEGDPNAESIGGWVQAVYPIRDEEGRARLRRGLVEAGVPVPNE